MRKIFITALFLWPLWSAAAQGTATPNTPLGAPSNSFLPDEGRAPYRTEFISYDIRREADEEITDGSKYFRTLKFAQKRHGVYEAAVEIPSLWLERNVYIRDTGRTGRYRLSVNGVRSGYNTDSHGGGEWFVTPLLKEGQNMVTIQMLAQNSAGSDMERVEASDAPTVIDNLYLFSQPRVFVFDYQASGHFDSEFKDDIVDMAVVVANGFNMPETVQVGYDIWGPDGVRKDFVMQEATIAGRSCDTVRLRYKVIGTTQYSAARPALYRVVLQLRHGGRPTEYIPFNVGFGLTTYDGKRVSRGGVPIEVKAAEVDFPTPAGASERLKALKREGVNTLAVTHPQQKWFYDMAAEEGMWVIDRAAVEADPRGDDRTVGGTVANDPAYLDRFLDRQSAMFYRRRNYPNVIGWSIGSVSGNGYNLYKSYQFLKTLDGSRPVVYPGADGEFNSDPLIINH